jgi:hypothetical protein
MEKAGREETFEEFLELLMDQAMEMGSSYSKSSYEDQEEKKSKPDRPFKPDHNTGYKKPVPKGSWAAEVKPQAQAGGPSSPWKFGPCDCYNTESHGFIECTIFKSKTPQERILFINKV